MESNSNTSQRSFFDLLALADVERVHSAVIGWLLSDDCKALAIEERSQVLHKLFGVEETKVYKEIKMELEWGNIDIFWKTKDKDDIEACWVLENKIKSSQHSNQLKKYKECVEKIYQDQARHYCFLTVIGEPAKNSEVEYKNRTYSDLVSVLKPYFEGAKGESHWVIAREYFETIRRMTEVTDTFLKAPANFPHVFTDGNKSVREKHNNPQWDNLPEDKKYISEKGMETLMQKYYLYKVMEAVLGNPQNPLIKRWHVGETRGNADMAIHFEKYPERVFVDDKKKESYWVYDSEDEIPYQFDISFQNGTFKFAISDRYWSNECWHNNKHAYRNQESVKKFVKLWEDILDNLKNEDMTLNHPKNNGRARLSLSYSIAKLEPQMKEPWYCWDKELFIKVVKREFEKAFDLRRKVIEEYKRNHEQDINSWRKKNKQNIERKAKAEAEKEAKKKKIENNGGQ